MEKMKNKPPRDSWLIQGEEDLIKFNIPQQEKELKQKLANIREQVLQKVDSIAIDQIYDEIILNYQSNGKNAVQGLLYQGEILWNKESHSLSDWMNKVYEKTLEVIRRELLELLEEPMVLKFQDVVMSENEFKLLPDALKGYVKCKICGYLEYNSFNNHLKDIHGMTYEDYNKKFPSSPIVEDLIQRIE